MKIVVATDFSESSQIAARALMSIASKAEFHLLHVVDGTMDGTDHAALLASFAADFAAHAGTPNVVQALRSGPQASRAIAQYAKEQQADLIVVGSRGGSSLLSGRHLGSTVINVVHYTLTPLLVIPMAVQIPLDWKKLGYATDLVDSDRELDRLVPFVRLFGMDLEAFFITPTFPEEVDLDAFNPDVYSEKMRALHGLAAMPFHFIITENDNDIARGTADYVRLYKPTALAMFSRRRSMFDRIFSPSRSERIARVANYPVFIFPVENEPIDIPSVPVR